MRQIQRRLAHHQHQAPALFEQDVGGAGDQIIGIAVGDGCERFHRAWSDDHASVANEPLAIVAPTSRTLRTTSASDASGDAAMPASRAYVRPW